MKLPAAPTLIVNFKPDYVRNPEDMAKNHFFCLKSDKIWTMGHVCENDVLAAVKLSIPARTVCREEIYRQAVNMAMQTAMDNGEKFNRDTGLGWAGTLADVMAESLENAVHEKRAMQ